VAIDPAAAREAAVYRLLVAAAGFFRGIISSRFASA